MYEFALFLRLTRPAVKKEDRLKFILSDLRLDFRRSLVSGLVPPRETSGRRAGSSPEQRLVIEPTVT